MSFKISNKGWEFGFLSNEPTLLENEKEIYVQMNMEHN